MKTGYFEYRDPNHPKTLYLKGKKSLKNNLLFMAAYPFLKPVLYNKAEMMSRQLGYEGWLTAFIYPSDLMIADYFYDQPIAAYAQKNTGILRRLLDNPDYPIDTVVCCWGNAISDFITSKFLEHQLYRILDILIHRDPPLRTVVLDYIKDTRIPVGIDKIRLNKPLVLKDYDAKTERKKIRLKYNLPPDISYRM